MKKWMEEKIILYLIWKNFFRESFFRENSNGRIEVDGWNLRDPFVRVALQFGLDRKWIEYVGQGGSDEQQYTTLIYSLTLEGDKYFT